MNVNKKWVAIIICMAFTMQQVQAVGGALAAKALKEAAEAFVKKATKEIAELAAKSIDDFSEIVAKNLKQVKGVTDDVAKQLDDADRLFKKYVKEVPDFLDDGLEAAYKTAMKIAGISDDFIEAGAKQVLSKADEFAEQTLKAFTVAQKTGGEILSGALKSVDSATASALKSTDDLVEQAAKALDDEPLFALKGKGKSSGSHVTTYADTAAAKAGTTKDLVAKTVLENNATMLELDKLIFELSASAPVTKRTLKQFVPFIAAGVIGAGIVTGVVVALQKNPPTDEPVPPITPDVSDTPYVPEIVTDTPPTGIVTPPTETVVPPVIPAIKKVNTSLIELYGIVDKVLGSCSVDPVTFIYAASGRMVLSQETLFDGEFDQLNAAIRASLDAWQAEIDSGKPVTEAYQKPLLDQLALIKKNHDCDPLTPTEKTEIASVLTTAANARRTLYLMVTYFEKIDPCAPCKKKKGNAKKACLKKCKAKVVPCSKCKALKGSKKTQCLKSCKK